MAKTLEVREENRERLIDRIPIGGSRDILTVFGKKPGFEYRWVKDVGNRVARFKRAGWEHETDADIIVGDARVGVASPLGSPVVADANMNMNGGDKLYLMRIPEQYYKEDQLAKEAELLKTEGSIGKNVEGIDGKISSSVRIGGSGK